MFRALSPRFSDWTCAVSTALTDKVEQCGELLKLNGLIA